MGTATMRFNEGVVISGSISTDYASTEGVALVCTGSLEIAANATNNEVIRIMSSGDQREMVFESQGAGGGGVSAKLTGNGSGGLRLQDPYSAPANGDEFRINDGTLYTYRIYDTITDPPQNPPNSGKVWIQRSTNFTTMRDNIIAALNGTATASQAKYYNGQVSNRANVTAASNGGFTGGITLTATSTGTGGNNYTFFTNMGKLSAITNTQYFSGGSAGSGTTNTNVASIHTDSNYDLILSGAGSIELKTGPNERVFIMSGSSDAPGSPNESNATDINFFVSGSVDSRDTSKKGTAVFGGDMVISGTLSVNRSDSGGYSMVTVTTDGKVGIGTDTPGNKLSVGGNMDVGEYIYHKNDQDTYVRFAGDILRLTAGGKIGLVLSEGSTDQVFIGTSQDQSLGYTNKYDQVLVMSGGGASSPNEQNAKDINFFVSGSTGSKGTSTKGTAVFGGDVVVSGSLDVGEYIYHNGDDDTFIRFGVDELHLAAGGRTFLKLEEGGTDKLIVNHGALDIDFQVKGENDANLIRTDAANDKIGIGTSSPNEILTGFWFSKSARA